MAGRLAFAAALAFLPAAAAAAPAPARSISYDTGPCLGACPDYRVTVTADGQGLFEGPRTPPSPAPAASG